MNVMTTVRLALQVGLVTLLAGCASVDQQPQGDGASSRWRDCSAALLDEAPGQSLGDLRSDAGRSVSVRLTPAGEGPCAGGLVARTEDGVVGIDVAALDLVASSAQVVRLRSDTDGNRRELLVVHGGVHPRGGYQSHLFVFDGRLGGLRELRVDGDPLLPFVATDGGAAPMTARCTEDGGIELLSATLTEPATKAPAWDITRTTYRWDGSALRPSGSQRISHAVPPTQLSNQWPALSNKPELFANCRG